MAIIAILLFFLWVTNLGSSGGSQPSAQSQPASSGESSSSGSSTKWTDNDIEYKLAVIDKSGFVSYDDPGIDQYERALNALELKCTESRTTLADQSVRSVQLLAENGVISNTLEMIRSAEASIPSELGETRCSEVFATLIVLMTQG